MASIDRVVWTEGMFLRPQHFQQQDRFLLARIRAGVAGLQPYRWGFDSLTVDKAMLETGKIAVSQCRGVFADGAPFELREGQELVIDLNENMRDDTVFLGVPISSENVNAFSNSPEDKHVRNFSHAVQVYDNTDSNNSTAEVNVARPRLQLLTTQDQLDAYQTLAVAQVVQVGADRNVTLDEDFIPPTLDSNRQPILAGYISELEGMLHQRAESIAGRVSGAGKTSTEISDFLLLQVINRIEPHVHHLTTLPDLHPQALYAELLQIAGELATFTRKERRPQSFGDYQHDNLAGSFAEVMNGLRASLSAVLEQAATQIELSAANQYGIRTASVGNREMLQKALFVLAVRADVPDNTLRQGLPGQIKIGAVEKIAQLINKSLPGVGISALPAAPRQIPFHAGTTYFQLDTSSSAWADILPSGGIALHVAGQFPGLDMTLWAVRQ